MTPVSPAGAMPPKSLRPHATTLPSLLRAAKALPVLKICVTPPNPNGAMPPETPLPQEKMLPSLLSAVNAA